MKKLLIRIKASWNKLIQGSYVDSDIEEYLYACDFVCSKCHFSWDQCDNCPVKLNKKEAKSRLFIANPVSRGITP